jgi:hypothetical protein
MVDMICCIREPNELCIQLSYGTNSLLHTKNILLLFLRLQTSESKTILIDMCLTLLHMSSLFYVNETLPDCPNLSFIITTDNQNITRMIWLPLQIKNHNCLVEVMPSIVLSPDPNMQAKRKSIQQELDLENGCIILETNKPNLKGTKYVRECYARKHLQLKRQQAQFWKLINEANDRMQDETTKLLHAWIPKEAVQSIYIYIMLVIGTSKHKLSFMRRSS